MIRFACPKCDKGLRADDAKAGGLVACPACSHKFRIPEPVAEPELVEEVEPAEAEEEPSPRRGKRRKFRRKPTDVDRGRKLVLVIIGVVVGMYVFSTIRYFVAVQQVRSIQSETDEKIREITKGLPEKMQRQIEEDRERLNRQLGMRSLEEEVRRQRFNDMLWLVGPVGITAILFTFLYLRHDWARVVLGVLFLIGGAMGVIGLGRMLFHAEMFRYLGTGAVIFSVFESLIRVAVSLGIGALLMQSDEIQAYTAPRRRGELE